MPKAYWANNLFQRNEETAAENNKFCQCISMDYQNQNHLDYRKDDIYKIREGIMISNIIAHIRYTSLAIALTSYVFCCISCMTAL